MNGQPLPFAAEPRWVKHVKPSRMGLLPVPEIQLSSLQRDSSIFWYLVLCLVYSFPFSLLVLMGIYEIIENLGPIARYSILGLVCIGLVYCLRCRGQQFRLRRLRPEVSAYPVVPGKLEVVLIPQPQDAPVASARLLLRENRFTSSFRHWRVENLWQVDLPLDGAGSVLHTTFALPHCVLPSSQSYDYKLEWLLEIERHRGSRTITDQFILWVPEELVKQGPGRTVTLQPGRVV